MGWFLGWCVGWFLKRKKHLHLWVPLLFNLLFLNFQPHSRFTIWIIANIYSSITLAFQLSRFTFGTDIWNKICPNIIFYIFKLVHAKHLISPNLSITITYTIHLTFFLFICSISFFKIIVKKNRPGAVFRLYCNIYSLHFFLHSIR